MDASSLEIQTKRKGIHILRGIIMNKKMKDIIMFISGSAVLVTGIALVLIWWPYVVDLSKGLIGMLLAVVGLIILFFIKD